MPLCPQITNTPITVTLTADFTVTNVLPVLAANTEQLTATNAAAAAAQATATSALANAAVAYNAAIGSLQPSANTIVNASNQMTAINGTGITVFSGASATTGARVVLNSLGLAGFDSTSTGSSNGATFSISATTGAAVFKGSITGSAITGSTLNISGNCIIDASGFLTATGATITGTINSTVGNIGGFTINSTSLTGSGGFTLSSTGQIDGGNANSIFYGFANIGGGAATGERLIVAGNSSFNGTITAIGSSFVGQMNYSGVATGAGTAMVLVSTGSRVAIVTSSERFKEEIKYINTTGWLDKVIAMKPITYKTSVDFTTEGEPNETQIGFLAEDIADIGGGLEKAVVLDPLGEPFSLSYDRLTVFLTLAIKELKAEIDQLKGE